MKESSENTRFLCLHHLTTTSSWLAKETTNGEHTSQHVKPTNEAQPIDALTLH